MKQNENIAIFKLGGLGDILLATPAIRAMKKSFPDLDIIFITGKSNIGAIENNPFIKEIICIDDAKLFRGNFFEKISVCCELYKKIKPFNIKEIFILHKDWRYNFLFFLYGIKKRYGYKRDFKGLFLNYAATTNENEHDIEKYFKVFEFKPNYKRDNINMDLFPSKEDIEKVDNYLKQINNNNKKIAIMLGGAANAKEEMKSRRWSVNNYKILIQKLLDNPFNLFLIGSNNDKKYNEEILLSFEKYKNVNLFDVAGLFSISGTCEFLRRMDLLISHDCGPMHIGATANIPVLSIFGPTSPIEKAPITNNKSIAIWLKDKVKCIPCYFEGHYPECKKNYACMNLITPEMVFENVINILK